MSTGKETSEYIPQTQWPDLEELAKGYHEHLMSASQKLANTEITLLIEKTMKVSHTFDDKNVTWHILEGGDQTGLSGVSEYNAFEVRSDFFFIDFHKPEYEEEVSIVLNTKTGQATVTISGFYVTEKGEKRTWTKLHDAFMEGRGEAEPFRKTDELIGKHVMYRYTPRDVYEHVYLNKGTMTWHCLSGTEKGLADTERCEMRKLSNDLYLLFWTETIMPVESVIVVDLEYMRSTGRFFCWDPRPKRTVRMMFGSYATVLAETSPAKTLAELNGKSDSL